VRVPRLPGSEEVVEARDVSVTGYRIRELLPDDLELLSGLAFFTQLLSEYLIDLSEAALGILTDCRALAAAAGCCFTASLRLFFSGSLAGSLLLLLLDSSHVFLPLSRLWLPSCAVTPRATVVPAAVASSDRVSIRHQPEHCPLVEDRLLADDALKLLREVSRAEPAR
jgi:hypothetical protein